MAALKQFIFVNSDIDGALGYLLLKWVTRSSPQYKNTSIFSLEKDFGEWYKTNGDKYSRVYIVGVNISDQLNLVNKDNVVIFNHRSSVEKLSRAKLVTGDYGSTARLVYESFKDKIDFTDQQKILMLLIDDIKRYDFGLPGSRDLDILYRSFRGDKTLRFSVDFATGFTGFSKIHRSLINFYRKALANVLGDLKVYIGHVPFKGRQLKVISTFSDMYINEISDELIKRHKSDVCCVVNLERKRVSYRRSSECDVDLSVLADKISDGGGFPYAASGDLNDNFMTLTKIFKQVK